MFGKCLSYELPIQNGMNQPDVYYLALEYIIIKA
jgi:hypothetical protein